MKYIIYELIYTPFLDFQYRRTELKNDKALKNYLFKHKNNLTNIEIFNKSNKCEIKFEVILNEKEKVQNN